MPDFRPLQLNSQNIYQLTGNWYIIYSNTLVCLHRRKLSNYNNIVEDWPEMDGCGLWLYYECKILIQINGLLSESVVTVYWLLNLHTEDPPFCSKIYKQGISWVFVISVLFSLESIYKDK